MPKAKNETTPETITFPTPRHGVEIVDSGAGRPVRPSLVIEDAKKSLAESAKNISKAWCAYENVTSVQAQPLIREWVKASRQLGCGLSRRQDEHANGTTTLAFRCQAKRERKASE